MIEALQYKTCYNCGMQTRPVPTRAPAKTIHRRQVILQIWLPIVLVTLVVLAAAVMAVVFSGTGGVDAGQLASISVIWLVLPFIVSGLLFLLFTLGMIFILARALRILPVYTHLVQLYANIINVRVTDFMDRLARPVIEAHGRTAGWKAIWRRRKSV